MHGRRYSQWVYAGHGQVVILQRQRGFDGAAFGLTAQPPGIRQTNPFLEHLRYVQSFKL